MDVTPTSTMFLRRFAWFIVFFTVFIILWGAWVRISGSGAGCGDHWPLCNGEVIPQAASQHTWIEFFHRFSTGIFGLFVILQVIMVWRKVPRGHPARLWSVAVLVFTVTEALIGAQLVVKGLVVESRDLGRVIVMPLHLLNTSVLLLSEVATAEAMLYKASTFHRPEPRRRRLIVLLISIVTLMIATGGIAALGVHLSSSYSMLDRLAEDFGPGAHPAVRFRILHPLLGLILPLIGAIVCARLYRSERVLGQRWWLRTAIGFFLTAVIGVLTFVLASPPVLKLSHLLLANLLVITLSAAIFHTVASSGSAEGAELPR